MLALTLAALVTAVFASGLLALLLARGGGVV
jgi:hypothetical protein